MTQANLNPRLSRISTLWSVLAQAHNGPADEARAAQQSLWERYGGAVRRYLRGAVHDPDAAADLAQEFAVRFLSGKFRRVDPARGRFRDYVKGVLSHLISDFRRRQRALPPRLESDHPELAVEPPSLSEMDREFVASWRQELLARCWTALADHEQRTGQLFHTMLHFRAEHPDATSPQLAKKLGEQLGKPLTAMGVRQTLHRARAKFADLLLEEVMPSLSSPDFMVEELADLGLLDYCRPALRHAETVGGRQ
jgi:RNA polymerase sigma-70 factor (ECF subfamily)